MSWTVMLNAKCSVTLLIAVEHIDLLRPRRLFLSIGREIRTRKGKKLQLLTHRRVPFPTANLVAYI